ncbi:MAG: hypothetical protein DME34_00350 [Verrucomicrobia bacterium]|nr:MAG: hypothetical protein DME34_00350 [Verrucomicrobiota bacterium]
MLFNSFEFWIFFAVVVIGFYSLPYRAGKVLLLAASYFFYMWWNPRFIVLILASTVADYFPGILLETAADKTRKPSGFSSTTTFLFPRLPRSSVCRPIR